LAADAEIVFAGASLSLADTDLRINYRDPCIFAETGAVEQGEKRASQLFRRCRGDVLALDVFEAGGFAAQCAQVIEFGAPDF